MGFAFNDRRGTGSPRGSRPRRMAHLPRGRSARS